jgi:hypothetical protein
MPNVPAFNDITSILSLHVLGLYQRRQSRPYFVDTCRRGGGYVSATSDARRQIGGSLSSTNYGESDCRRVVDCPDQGTNTQSKHAHTNNIILITVCNRFSFSSASIGPCHSQNAHRNSKRTGRQLAAVPKPNTDRMLRC